MKLNWSHKKFTLVIIPDVNRSVRRFEVPSLLPYVAGLATIALLSVSVTIFVFYGRTSLLANELQDQVVSQEVVYQDVVDEKNEMIDKLQNEVIQLSQRTEDMKIKIDDIRKLEDEVRSITGSANSVAIIDAEAPIDSAMGGISHPAADSEVAAMLVKTTTQLNDMDKEVVELKQSIADSKNKALAVKEQLRVTPTIWPSASRRISSGFGLRKDPFNNRPSFHSGYDISAPANSEVYVTADGKVKLTGTDSERGNHILVDHGKGLQTWYMHLNAILVQKGDPVLKGQNIGLVGSTGRSTGYHLHYEVLQNGESIDPMPYLK
ncbi:M23 family metallopeptidase [Paenibacillus agricola]|uniref:Peptidoglycan DD-metalloendopeptidase family protein n=1 Tax=Paenibacillus agricola TaxID=2716264 RepID=A0ABX0J5N7_9BACL|nr:M23 family metallopeptidase [Paenibacillus agricola]NHN29364.1 peptidoglycan DD-metalloendopeptidase family protein [Paenibacillus agricola]